MMVQAQELGLGGSRLGSDHSLVGTSTGVHAATHPFFEDESVEDGRNPFEAAVSLLWLEVGLTVRPR